jgi:hypothetical protein
VQHLLDLKEALIGCFVAMSFSWSVVEMFKMAQPRFREKSCGRSGLLYSTSWSCEINTNTLAMARLTPFPPTFGLAFGPAAITLGQA